jgi:hypothetical protein
MLKIEKIRFIPLFIIIWVIVRIVSIILLNSFERIPPSNYIYGGLCFIGNLIEIILFIFCVKLINLKFSEDGDATKTLPSYLYLLLFFQVFYIFFRTLFDLINPNILRIIVSTTEIIFTIISLVGILSVLIQKEMHEIAPLVSMSSFLYFTDNLIDISLNIIKFDLEFLRTFQLILIIPIIITGGFFILRKTTLVISTRLNEKKNYK